MQNILSGIRKHHILHRNVLIWHMRQNLTTPNGTTEWDKFHPQQFSHIEQREPLCFCDGARPNRGQSVQQRFRMFSSRTALWKGLWNKQTFPSYSATFSSPLRLQFGANNDGIILHEVQVHNTYKTDADIVTVYNVLKAKWSTSG